jgi:hypothetical protein
MRRKPTRTRNPAERPRSAAVPVDPELEEDRRDARAEARYLARRRRKDAWPGEPIEAVLRRLDEK